MHGARLALTVMVMLLGPAWSATALAGNGYRVWATAWHRPPSGSSFSVLAHGVAAQKALLYVYLDRQPCRWTWATESRRNVTPFKTGESSFRDTGRALVTLWVSGRFSRAFTARAGTTAEPEYVCAYLTTPNPRGRYRLTAARRSNAYVVTG